MMFYLYLKHYLLYNRAVGCCSFLCSTWSDVTIRSLPLQVSCSGPGAGVIVIRITGRGLALNSGETVDAWLGTETWCCAQNKVVVVTI